MPDARQLDEDAHDTERAPSDAGATDAQLPRAQDAQTVLDAAQQDGGTSARDGSVAVEAGETLVQQPWPAAEMPAAVDPSGAFPNNLSALGYEPAQGALPARLWAMQNEPPALFRLLWDGALWQADSAEGWARGKTLRFPNGGGRPDTEGLALLPSAGGVRFVYAASERDTDAIAGRQSILRFDVSASGAELTASQEWNLTSAIPPTALNAGIEAIAFVSDGDLTGLFDESRGRDYEPEAYAEHAGGLFLVGVEATSTIHAFVLDHQSASATRVASIASGLPGVMALEYDGDTGYLWAHCDDACGNRTTLLELDGGRFVVRRELGPPPGTRDMGNEGFALVPDAECSGGRKHVFWAEDSATGGHAIRRGSVPCGRSW